MKEKNKHLLPLLDFHISAQARFERMLKRCYWWEFKIKALFKHEIQVHKNEIELINEEYLNK